LGLPGLLETIYGGRGPTVPESSNALQPNRVLRSKHSVSLRIVSVSISMKRSGDARFALKLKWVLHPELAEPGLLIVLLKNVTEFVDGDWRVLAMDHSVAVLA